MQADILAYEIFKALVRKAERNGEFEYTFGNDSVCVALGARSKSYSINYKRSSGRKVLELIKAYAEERPMTAESILEVLK